MAGLSKQNITIAIKTSISDNSNIDILNYTNILIYISDTLYTTLNSNTDSAEVSLGVGNITIQMSNPINGNYTLTKNNNAVLLVDTNDNSRPINGITTLLSESNEGTSTQDPDETINPNLCTIEVPSNYLNNGDSLDITFINIVIGDQVEPQGEQQNINLNLDLEVSENFIYETYNCSLSIKNTSTSFVGTSSSDHAVSFTNISYSIGQILQLSWTIRIDKRSIQGPEYENLNINIINDITDFFQNYTVSSLLSGAYVYWTISGDIKPSFFISRPNDNTYSFQLNINIVGIETSIISEARKTSLIIRSNILSLENYFYPYSNIYTENQTISIPVNQQILENYSFNLLDSQYYTNFNNQQEYTSNLTLSVIGEDQSNPSNIVFSMPYSDNDISHEYTLWLYFNPKEELEQYSLGETPTQKFYKFVIQYKDKDPIILKWQPNIYTYYIPSN